jgi:hypothetical protein
MGIKIDFGRRVPRQRRGARRDGFHMGIYGIPMLSIGTGEGAALSRFRWVVMEVRI